MSDEKKSYWCEDCGKEYIVDGYCKCGSGLSARDADVDPDLGKTGSRAMTHQENLSAIRAACVAANPEIGDTRQIDPPNCGCTECATGEYRRAASQEEYEAKVALVREVTLPDVLLALGNGYAASGEGNVLKFGNQAMAGRSVWGFWEIGEGVKWNLRLPLSGQSEETVAYLANLLK